MKGQKDTRHQARKLALATAYCMLAQLPETTAPTDETALPTDETTPPTDKTTPQTDVTTPLETQLQSCKQLSIDNLNLQPTEWDEALLQNLLTGTVRNKKAIDAIIHECAPQWPLDKIFKIDLVILEIAVFEMIFSSHDANEAHQESGKGHAQQSHDRKGHDQTAPEKVVIDEAIELAKEFGNETSSKFVNGVLGTVLENKEKYVPKKDTKINS